MSNARQDGLLDGIFGRGAAGTGDDAWLQAMLDVEAALARAAERAGVAGPGAGAAVTAVAVANQFDAAELKGLRPSPTRLAVARLGGGGSGRVSRPWSEV